MRRPHAVIAAALAGLAACVRQDTGISAGEGDLREPPSALDFGDVDVGRGATLRLALHNDGIGALAVAAAIDGEPDFTLASEPGEIAPGAEGEVAVTFRPSAEGAHAATLVLTTDDPDAPRVERPLLGAGVVPTLTATPTSLWFGDLDAGTVVTRTATLAATGSGAVTLQAIDAGHAAYAWELPEDVALPHTLAAGHAIAVFVTYTAPAAPASADLLVTSSDVAHPVTAIRLEAGASESAGAPRLDLVSPVWGEAFLDDEPVTAQIHVTDPDDRPQDLTVLVYVDGALAIAASPENDGTLAVPLGALAPGAHALVARAVDPDGSLDEDRADVAVYAPDDVTFTLSGGDSSYAYLSVDDDLRVTVNGALAYADSSGHQSTLAPIAFQAAVGDVLRVVATDANPCRKHLDPIVLHFGTTRRRALVDETGASSCPEDPDYDASYTGPWPNDFVDATFTLDVP